MSKTIAMAAKSLAEENKAKMENISARVDAVDTESVATHEQQISVDSLPAAAIDAPINVLSMEGLTLVNAVENGDFGDGTTRYGAENGSSISVSSNVLSNTGDGTADKPRTKYSFESALADGDDYFIFCKAKVSNAECAEISIRQEYTVVDSQPNPTENEWIELYGIFTASTTNRLRFYHNYADAATANGKVMEVDGNAGVFAINMTALGIEDYTEAEMLELVRGGYFEGIKSVDNPALEVVGKNLIDETELIKGYFLGSNFNYTGDEAVYRSAKVYLKAGTYKFSATGPCSVIRYIIDGVYYNSSSTTFTLTEDGYFGISFRTPDSSPWAGISVQLEKGTEATTYEPRESSQITSSDLTLRRVPNGTQDTVDIVGGELIKTKRVEEYVLTADDISNLAGGTHVQRVNIGDSALTNFKTQNTSHADGSVIFGDTRFLEEVEISWDEAENEWAFETTPTSGSLILLMVPLGTYADLAAAKADLAGTVIQYELEDPETINLTNPEQDARAEGQLLSFEDGTLYNSADYFQGNVDLSVPINQAAAVDGLIQSVNALSKDLASKADTEQEDWIEPTLLNSWTGLSGYRNAYYKDSNGLVHLELSVEGGTNYTDVIELPVGYRPSTSVIEIGFSANQDVRTLVRNNGLVQIGGTGIASGGYWSGHLVFRAEA